MWHKNTISTFLYVKGITLTWTLPVCLNLVRFYKSTTNTELEKTDPLLLREIQGYEPLLTIFFVNQSIYNLVLWAGLESCPIENIVSIQYHESDGQQYFTFSFTISFAKTKNYLIKYNAWEKYSDTAWNRGNIWNYIEQLRNSVELYFWLPLIIR